jgi:hypothetical protein
MRLFNAVFNATPIKKPRRGLKDLGINVSKKAEKRLIYGYFCGRLNQIQSD